jgi:thiol-disulfide isomerase/thioredoxin
MSAPRVCALILLGLGAAGAAQTPVNPLVVTARQGMVGMHAPALRLTTIDGEQINLADLYGKKAVYLKFWATWCIPCRQQMPHFENVYQHAGNDLAVIALNAGFSETLQEIRAYRRQLGIHMPIVVDDGSLAGLFNLRITPQHVVIGKDGVVKYVGNRADAELDAILDRERKAPANEVKAVAFAARGEHLKVGSRLPDETMAIAGGGSIALREAGARGTVLVFMVPWCESYLGAARPQSGKTCREVREQVESLQMKYPGFRWLGISSGIWTSTDDLVSYARDNKVSLPLTLDDRAHLFRRFGVKSVPTVVVANAKGVIVKRFEGRDAALEPTLAGLKRE